MPTPIEILLDPISLIVLALYAGQMMWDALAYGRPLPLFGSFRNPRHFELETGIYPVASECVADMLLFKYVNGISNNEKPAVAAT